MLTDLVWGHKPTAWVLGDVSIVLHFKHWMLIACLLSANLLIKIVFASGKLRYLHADIDHNLTFPNKNIDVN